MMKPFKIVGGLAFHQIHYILEQNQQVPTVWGNKRRNQAIKDRGGSTEQIETLVGGGVEMLFCLKLANIVHFF